MQERTSTHQRASNRKETRPPTGERVEDCSRSSHCSGWGYLTALRDRTRQQGADHPTRPLMRAPVSVWAGMATPYPTGRARPGRRVWRLVHGRRSATPTPDILGEPHWVARRIPVTDAAAAPAPTTLSWSTGVRRCPHPARPLTTRAVLYLHGRLLLPDPPSPGVPGRGLQDSTPWTCVPAAGPPRWGSRPPGRPHHPAPAGRNRPGQNPGPEAPRARTDQARAPRTEQANRPENPATPESRRAVHRPWPLPPRRARPAGPLRGDQRGPARYPHRAAALRGRPQRPLHRRPPSGHLGRRPQGRYRSTSQWTPSS